MCIYIYITKIFFCVCLLLCFFVCAGGGVYATPEEIICVCWKHCYFFVLPLYNGFEVKLWVAHGVIVNTWPENIGIVHVAGWPW